MSGTQIFKGTTPPFNREMPLMEIYDVFKDMSVIYLNIVPTIHWTITQQLLDNINV